MLNPAHLEMLFNGDGLNALKLPSDKVPSDLFFLKGILFAGLMLKDPGLKRYDRGFEGLHEWLNQFCMTEELFVAGEAFFKRFYYLGCAEATEHEMDSVTLRADLFIGLVRVFNEASKTPNGRKLEDEKKLLTRMLRNLNFANTDLRLQILEFQAKTMGIILPAKGKPN